MATSGNTRRSLASAAAWRCPTNLAMGVVGVLSFWGNHGFRLAVAIMANIFFGIDGIGHVRQMVLEGIFATGNAGSWF